MSWEEKTTQAIENLLIYASAKGLIETVDMPYFRNLLLDAFQLDAPAGDIVPMTDVPPTATAHVGPGFAALPSALRGHIDVAAAVAPYVPDGASDLLPHGTLDQEPPSALLGGTDGLDVVRVLLAEASDWLAPGGRLLLDIDPVVRDLAIPAQRHATLLDVAVAPV